MSDVKRERREALATALRSGEYKQGKFKLRRTDDDGDVVRHCCLGVACDVFMRETGDGEWDDDDRFVIDDPDPDVGVLAEGAIMPDRVRDWFGLGSNSGAFSDPITGSLLQMNDANYSFDQIAQKILDEPQGLVEP